MHNKKVTFLVIFIGLSVAFITQSFNSIEPNKWGNDNGVMVDLSSYTGRDDDPLPAANTYRCDFSEEVICSGTYVGTPTQPEDLTDTDLGIFSIN